MSSKSIIATIVLVVVLGVLAFFLFSFVVGRDVKVSENPNPTDNPTDIPEDWQWYVSPEGWSIYYPAYIASVGNSEIGDSVEFVVSPTESFNVYLSNNSGDTISSLTPHITRELKIPGGYVRIIWFGTMEMSNQPELTAEEDTYNQHSEDFQKMVASFRLGTY